MRKICKIWAVPNTDPIRIKSAKRAILGPNAVNLDHKKGRFFPSGGFTFPRFGAVFLHTLAQFLHTLARFLHTLARLSPSSPLSTREGVYFTLFTLLYIKEGYKRGRGLFGSPAPHFLTTFPKEGRKPSGKKPYFH
jgi:hypothetical protein